MHILNVGSCKVYLHRVATHRWELRKFEDYKLVACHRGSRHFISAYLKMQGRQNVQWEFAFRAMALAVEAEYNRLGL